MPVGYPAATLKGMTPSPNDYLQQAIDAVARGFHVWPSQPDGKHPRARAYKGVADFGLTTPEQVKGVGWPHGVCIMLGPRDYVLDADVPGAVPKLERYDTLRVRTKRGMHAYFRLPEGTRLAQGRRVGSGIDGKGFAWATGTRTVALWAGLDGREICNDVPVMELPSEWVTHIGPPKVYVPSDLTPGMLRVLAHYEQSLPERGYTRGAEQAIDLAAHWLREELGADGWGHDFYRVCAWFGEEYVATGECTLPAARAAFISIFEALDRWKKDPSYVLGSIDNGLLRGLSDALGRRMAPRRLHHVV